MIEEFPLLVECSHCGADHETTVYVSLDGWGDLDLVFDEIGECDECGQIVDVEYVQQQVMTAYTSFESEYIRVWQNEQ